jgi:hypothetical protein
MLKKKLTKIVGLKKEDFDVFIQTSQIHVQPARLIPVLKTWDEMALTSIFMTTTRLVKEFKQNLFISFKIVNNGQAFFYTEACFPEIDKTSRIDGLIIVVVKWKITDAVFLEMKNKNNLIDKPQILKYIDVAKRLWVKKIVTISNQFVPDSSHSPIDIRVPKNMSLLHFSWVDILTKWQLLLFKNEDNIKDADQIEIMKEFLFYMENPLSWVSKYTKMRAWWKELVSNTQAKKTLKISDTCISDSILSWREEEKNLALLLSNKLWILVKSSSKSKESLGKDVKDFIKNNYIKWILSVKNSVSDIKIICDFERKSVSMSVKVIPPLNKWTKAKISWVWNQFEKCKLKKAEIFKKIENDMWVETNVKFAKNNIKSKISNLEELSELTLWKELSEFHFVYIKDFWASFSSEKKFIATIEEMIMNYYEWVVQHATSWKTPTPKLDWVKGLNI